MLARIKIYSYLCKLNLGNYNIIQLSQVVGVKELKELWS